MNKKIICTLVFSCVIFCTSKPYEPYMPFFNLDSTQYIISNAAKGAVVTVSPYVLIKYLENLATNKPFSVSADGLLGWAFPGALLGATIASFYTNRSYYTHAQNKMSELQLNALFMLIDEYPDITAQELRTLFITAPFPLANAFITYKNFYDLLEDAKASFTVVMNSSLHYLQSECFQKLVLIDTYQSQLAIVMEKIRQHQDFNTDMDSYNLAVAAAAQQVAAQAAMISAINSCSRPAYIYVG